ncbi:hypothetical protein A9Q84_07895 [Halobacteriovorax marinus]|uniref:Uncharacterized protein n=1 Tax=Halobacteriovorax marinus TaxID=97084 RepID=A0A1Y5F9U0_9BACT|nr:hypothetical protein A9Q84_07895 [Halobacteriovorax marinus]
MLADRSHKHHDSRDKVSLSVSLKKPENSLSINGKVQLPKYMRMTNTRGSFGRYLAVVQIDDSIECTYSPKRFRVGQYLRGDYKLYFKSCSDREGSSVIREVEDSISLELRGKTYFGRSNPVLQANFMVENAVSEVEGIELEGVNATEGQILKFNGDLWVAADMPEGSIGEKGKKGDAGLQGEQGEIGATGVQGVAGAQGIKGDKGDSGVAGAIGPQGLQGENGNDGVAGTAGAQGLPGIAGVAGEKGDTGAIGPQGLPGVVGAVGAVGAQGLPGTAGQAGDKGEKGDIGPQGLPGISGAVGAQGLPGVAGVAGIAGIKGDTGSQGLQGIQGLPGVAGTAGLIGATGAQGSQGIQGIQGATGETGAVGSQGLPGITGVAGKDGIDGKDGADASVDLSAGVGITGSIVNGVGTIAVDVGVEPGQIVQVGVDGRIPASLLPESEVSSSAQVAYIKDVKASGTHGGDCTSGTYVKRDLNTVSGESSFVSLANNQFSLAPGTYRIDANAPGYLENLHKAKLVNATIGQDVLLGSTQRSHTSYGGVTNSKIMGEFTITEASLFEIQHRCTTSRTIVGFGVAASFGDSEIYTQVKIVKVK